MRLRNIPRADSVLAGSDMVIKTETDYKGNWKEAIFHNSNPIHIEVGMGKGQFVLALARLNPDINYIGIERYSSVLLRAVEKLEEEVPNLRFICMDAATLPEVFDKNEISRIYLNFSDPWPKDRHAKRRLTSLQFLKRYNKILAPGGQIEFKTDNRDLFQFSLEQVEPAGWKLISSTWDLHHDETMNSGNVMTEYEQKFSAQGNPICKMVISR